MKFSGRKIAKTLAGHRPSFICFFTETFVYVSFQVVHKRLLAVLHHLIPNAGLRSENGHHQPMWFPARDISSESLIIGALEAAFWEMDKDIGEDKKRYVILSNSFINPASPKKGILDISLRHLHLAFWLIIVERYSFNVKTSSLIFPFYAIFL